MTKLWAYLGIGACLLIVGGLFGWHLGALNSAKQLSDYQAASAQALVAAKTAASVAQSQADQQAIAQAQAMVTQANAAVSQQQAAMAALQASLSATRRQLAANAKAPAVSAWLKTGIPTAALAGLCFPKTQADTCKEP